MSDYLSAYDRAIDEYSGHGDICECSRCLLEHPGRIENVERKAVHAYVSGAIDLTHLERSLDKLNEVRVKL